jgi:hypothetical protein
MASLQLFNSWEFPDYLVTPFLGRMIRVTG